MTAHRAGTVVAALTIACDDEELSGADAPGTVHFIDDDIALTLVETLKSLDLAPSRGRWSLRALRCGSAVKNDEESWVCAVDRDGPRDAPAYRFVDPEQAAAFERVVAVAQARLARGEGAGELREAACGTAIASDVRHVRCTVRV